MLITIIVICIILFVISFINMRKMDRELDWAILSSKKHFSMFLIMNKWLEAKQRDKRMDIFLKKRGYYKIAIYGMHYIGESLFKELEGSQIQILYGIDQYKDGCNCGLQMYKPNDELPKVDAVIVTTPLYFYTVKKILSNKLGVPIVSIEEVVEGMC